MSSGRQSQDDSDIDIVHRALKNLPAPRAPRTLLPRVMAAAAKKEQRAGAGAATWFAWPRTWQAASVVALVLLVIAGAWIWPAARELVTPSISSTVVAAWSKTVDLVKGAAAVASVTSAVWSSFVQPIVPYALVWIVLMSAACAGFGAAIGRVALGGASHS